jgi:integrase
VALAIFCLYHDVAFPGVSVFTVLAFIEFLNDNGISVPTIKNYISAVKSMFKLHNVACNAFDSPQISLALMSLTKNSIPSSVVKPILSPHQFALIINQTLRFPLHLFYKISFLFGFFALLRISNVAPASKAAFDPFRHLRRGDVYIKNNVLYIHLRWTKTLQRHRQAAIVPIYPVPGSPLCPLQAFIQLNKFFPVAPTDPFLSHRSASGLYIITQSQIRSIFKKCILYLSFDRALSFHSLRRSGASLAFASGVPFHSIQAHGTWSSDALWAYIDAGARDASVPRLFSRVFSSL